MPSTNGQENLRGRRRAKPEGRCVEPCPQEFGHWLPLPDERETPEASGQAAGGFSEFFEDDAEAIISWMALNEGHGSASFIDIGLPHAFFEHWVAAVHAVAAHAEVEVNERVSYVQGVPVDNSP